MNVILHMAEDVRLEMGNKVSLIGFMPGNLLQVRLPLDPASGNFSKRGILRLALLLSITGAPVGTNPFKMWIVTPDNKELPKSEGTFESAGADHRCNLVFNVPTFAAEKPGKHVVCLDVAGKTYENPFWLSSTPSATQDGSVSTH